MEALYKNHHRWLETWLHRQLDCGHQAADLSQDTFEQVLRAEREGRVPVLRQPRAYLATIARRVLINFWRRRDLERAWIDAMAELDEALVPSAESRVALLQALEQLDGALAGLPVKTREVFWLSQIEECTYAEISERLAMPIISVRRAMTRALTACVVARLDDSTAANVAASTTASAHAPPSPSASASASVPVVAV